MYHVHVISDDKHVQRIFGKSSSNQDVRYISINNENLNSYLPCWSLHCVSTAGAPVVVVFLDRSKPSRSEIGLSVKLYKVQSCART